MTRLTPFTHEFDGELLSGVSTGRDGNAQKDREDREDREDRTGSTGSTDGTDSGGDGPGAPASVVVLHGAGNGNKAALVPLLQEFAARGQHALAFDFSGHGESSGRLGELSLRRRFEQAASVIEGHVRASAPLTLVGFSMSGQTLADLVRHFGPRVTTLGLCAPAVYAAEAWEVPFGAGNGDGDGDGTFSEIIRRPDSWRDSPALAALRAYEGRAVLAVPRTDDVIPPAVTHAVTEALMERSHLTPVEYPRATHRLGAWFAEHPMDRRHFAETVTHTAG